MFLSVFSISSFFKIQNRETQSFVGSLLFVRPQGRGGGGVGREVSRKVICSQSPDSIWLKSAEQGSRVEEINQKSTNREGLFFFKRLRIVGFHAYSDGTRKDFNFFASFSSGANKTKVTKVEHIQNTHYNFFLPFKIARQHLVKDLGLHSTR